MSSRLSSLPYLTLVFLQGDSKNFILLIGNSELYMPLFSVSVGYVHVFMYVPIHVCACAWVPACAFVWNLKADNISLSP